MKIRKEPGAVWEEYGRGVDYKSGLSLYDNVRRNNDFFMDRQWEGVNAPNLDKPVFNILKPVVNYYTAMLISDDIAVNVELMGSVENEGGVTLQRKDAAGRSVGREESPDGVFGPSGMGVPGMGGFPMPETGEPGYDGNGVSLKKDAASFGPDEIIPRVIAAEVENVLERTNARAKNRRMLRNCAVDGDACFYLWFDPDAETGFDYTGEVKIDLVDNTNVYFGDPSNGDPQEQPYVILAFRRLTGEVRDEAEENGLPSDGIVPDNETRYYNSDRDGENDYTTVLLKLWKENGTVRFLKCTEHALVKGEEDTGYKLYPLAWMSWEAVKNSCHGTSPLTGKINNQIFINKIYALSMRFVALNAFPKVIYDETKLPEGWNNDVGKAVKVSGDPTQAIYAGFKPADMSADAMNMAHSTMQQTKDLMGASDAALGNVKPDNTSAIIAVQKAAGVPLDLQRMDFHSFVESYVRVVIEMMGTNYGVRHITLTDDDDNRLMGEFDFSLLKKHAYSLKVEIGAGTYWSEIMQSRTLDGLMANHILPDPALYLHLIPDDYIKDKNKVIELAKRKKGAPELPGMGVGAMPPMPLDMDGTPPMPPGVGPGGMPGMGPGGMPPMPLDMDGTTTAPPNMGPGGMPGMGPGGMPPMPFGMDGMPTVPPNMGPGGMPGMGPGGMPPTPLGMGGTTTASPNIGGTMTGAAKAGASTPNHKVQPARAQGEDLKALIDSLRALPYERAAAAVKNMKLSRKRKQDILKALR